MVSHRRDIPSRGLRCHRRPRHAGQPSDSLSPMNSSCDPYDSALSTNRGRLRSQQSRYCEAIEQGSGLNIVGSLQKRRKLLERPCRKTHRARDDASLAAIDTLQAYRLLIFTIPTQFHPRESIVHDIISPPTYPHLCTSPPLIHHHPLPSTRQDRVNAVACTHVRSRG